MKRSATAILLNTALLWFSANANAALTIVFEETGGDVVATATGSLDISGLSSASGPSAAGVLFYGASDQYIYEVGTGSGIAYTVSFSTAQTLHTSAFPATPASSDTGGPVGVLDSPAFTAGPRILVPLSYASGSPINATATWTGATFASLGLTLGSYLFDYPTGTGTDSITFEVQSSGVGPPLPPINQVLPVPAMPLAGLFMSIIGLSGIAAWRFKRRAAGEVR